MIFHGFLVFVINRQSEWSLVRELASGRDGTRTHSGPLTLSKVPVALLSNGKERRALQKVEGGREFSIEVKMMSVS